MPLRSRWWAALSRRPKLPENQHQCPLPLLTCRLSSGASSVKAFCLPQRMKNSGRKHGCSPVKKPCILVPWPPSCHWQGVKGLLLLLSAWESFQVLLTNACNRSTKRRSIVSGPNNISQISLQIGNKDTSQQRLCQTLNYCKKLWLEGWDSQDGGMAVYWKQIHWPTLTQRGQLILVRGDNGMIYIYLTNKR